MIMLKIFVMSFMILLFLSRLTASEQTNEVNSPYALGVSFGFCSLIPGNGSQSFAGLTDNKRKENVVGGFFFEYKLSGTESSVFFMSDALYMKFKKRE